MSTIELYIPNYPISEFKSKHLMSDELILEFTEYTK